MEREPVIMLFQGGVSGEREISLRSAAALLPHLRERFAVEVVTIDAAALPDGLDPARGVVFSVLHGVFGEDGGMQQLLDEAGWCYAGCDAKASALCMDKSRSKAVVAAGGVQVAEEWHLRETETPAWSEVVERLGTAVVLKPNAEGSSLGLFFPTDAASWAESWAAMPSGDRLVETYVPGRELSIGVLEGRALGVVEVIPTSGQYDYASKYTPGASRYLAPAPLDAATTAAVGLAAEKAFAVLGCRDYGRADFRLTPEGEIYFLEMNTLPGMTESSIFPQSAACCGMNFSRCLEGLLAPAVRRWKDRFVTFTTSSS